jgi:heme/copper-type cytochrome/quinol oxidase subunit 3
MQKTMTQNSQKITNEQVGMFVLLASFGMLFGTLLLSYLFARARQPAWPPIGVEPLDLRLSTLSTLIAVISSIFMHFSMKSFVKAEWNTFKNYWLASSFMGVLFVAMQSAFVCKMWETGLRVQDGLYQSVSYMLVIVHMLHVIAAWIPLAWVACKAQRGLYQNPTAQGPLLASWFWHFLGGVWFVTYLLLIWY